MFYGVLFLKSSEYNCGKKKLDNKIAEREDQLLPDT